ncbi:hypothetical protein ABZ746_20395 [Streptomyces sp. NPDC020096]
MEKTHIAVAGLSVAADAALRALPEFESLRARVGRTVRDRRCPAAR